MLWKPCGGNSAAFGQHQAPQVAASPEDRAACTADAALIMPELPASGNIQPAVRRHLPKAEVQRRMADSCLQRLHCNFSAVCGLWYRDTVFLFEKAF